MSAVGVTGIASNVPDHVDEYLDWAAPTYARLYEEARDRRYLDVTRTLVFDTKRVLALPCRTCDLPGPRWQQEHWRTGPGVRRIGAHRTLIPVKPRHSIMGLDQLDPAEYGQVVEGD